MYNKTVTVSYNGNSNTGGSTSSHSGTVYRNYAGTIINASFTLKSNGFSRTNYTFAYWTQGSTSGTVRKVGASVSLNSNTTFYAYWVQTTRTYSYTGGVQSFIAPVAGTYQLEVWGAQGNTRNYPGGKGGYATGNVYLTQGQTIYIVIGGQGSGVNGGYNGGGSGTGEASGGGGATHIATTNRGLLTAYNSYRGEVLIVAGGGGGSDFEDWSLGYDAYGGAGGGTSGTNGNPGGGQEQDCAGYGGTQTSAGSGHGTAGGFGYGGGGNVGGCGGGGWYGGGAGWNNNGAHGGGGGSGYTGGVSNGSMSNGVQTGNGKAKITFVSVS